jgi:multidrug resistance efflux pump
VDLVLFAREVARLHLDFTRVVAPISGRLGPRLIEQGNLVKANETELAMLTIR